MLKPTRQLTCRTKALSGEEKVFVIGGGKIYAQLLNHADWLYLTFVDKAVEGDAFFPRFEHLIGAVFTLRAEKKHDGYRFMDYERKVY